MDPVRPMREDDVAAVRELMVRAFADLDERRHRTPGPPGDPARADIRLRRCLHADPDGAWVSEREGRLTGCALAILREGVWGLSLLVVDPAVQSRGTGRALLAEAMGYGAGARGGIILASDDPRALRAYARAGFALHPCFHALGRPARRPERPASVRDGGPGDQDLVDAIDRRVRGAARGGDLGAMLEAGMELLVVEDRGYAVRRAGEVVVLAAHDDATARDLLHGVLAGVPDGAPAAVEWITARQDWAVEPVLEAGLELHGGGAVFVRGDVGPFRPYLPSGAYL